MRTEYRLTRHDFVGPNAPIELAVEPPDGDGWEVVTMAGTGDATVVILWRRTARKPLSTGAE